MRLNSKYRFCRKGRWHLLIDSERWSEGLWEEILRKVSGQEPSKHPQTKEFIYPAGKNHEKLYLKIYHRSRSVGALKDCFRDSKAFRALKLGEALSKRGFHAPFAVAAGEERGLGLLRRAFFLTLSVEGVSLPQFLRERFSVPLDADGVRVKREYLQKLALETRRLHQSGFVHGDLVPTNIFLRSKGTGLEFFLMDNDRTRRYPAWFPHRLWKRNLVQLNRFALPGISLQDRMRFLRFYLGRRSWGKKDHRLLSWLEKTTRKRRRQCDRIQGRVSFRELMRWNGPYTSNIQ